jgi:hypothetical protein
MSSNCAILSPCWPSDSPTTTTPRSMTRSWCFAARPGPTTSACSKCVAKFRAHARPISRGRCNSQYRLASTRGSGRTSVASGDALQRALPPGGSRQLHPASSDQRAAANDLEDWVGWSPITSLGGEAFGVGARMGAKEPVHHRIATASYLDRPTASQAIREYRAALLARRGQLLRSPQEALPTARGRC